jgi:rhamnose transport system permease protein
MNANLGIGGGRHATPASWLSALVAAVAVALVIITRQIDISIGAQFSVCAVVAGLAASSGMPVVIAAALALLLAAGWILKNTNACRFLYATGSDAEAARLAGIRPKAVTFSAFIVMGGLVGLAAALNLAQSPQVQPNSGDGLELKAIAAAVVGGVAISGGRGTVWGALLGMMLLANVNPALTHFHQPPYWEKAIQGMVILLAVAADGLGRSRKLNRE